MPKAQSLFKFLTSASHHTVYIGLGYSTSSSNVHKLQTVQNALAITVARSPKSLPALHLNFFSTSVGSLSINESVSNCHSNLKGSLLSIHTQQPTYLSSLPSFQSSASFYWPVSSKCSQNENRIRSSCLLLRSPQIWNQISLAIRTSPSPNCFKDHLKAHYFTTAWDSNPPSDSLHLGIKFSLNAGAYLLHYITPPAFKVPFTGDRKDVPTMRKLKVKPEGWRYNMYNAKQYL